jgi:hypothetical protein
MPAGAAAGLVTGELAEGDVWERSLSSGTIWPFPFMPSLNFWVTSSGVCSVTLQAAKEMTRIAKQNLRRCIIPCQTKGEVLLPAIFMSLRSNFLRNIHSPGILSPNFIGCFRVALSPQSLSFRRTVEGCHLCNGLCVTVSGCLFTSWSASSSVSTPSVVPIAPVAEAPMALA